MCHISVSEAVSVSALSVWQAQTLLRHLAVASDMLCNQGQTHRQHFKCFVTAVAVANSYFMHQGATVARVCEGHCA